MMPIIRFVCCGKETFTLQLQKSNPASHQEDVYTVTHEKARSYADAMPHATFIQKADTISPIFSHFYKTCKYFYFTFPSQTCMHKRKKRIKCEVKYTFSFHLITSIFKSKVAWRFFFHCREKKMSEKTPSCIFFCYHIKFFITMHMPTEKFNWYIILYCHIILQYARIFFLQLVKSLEEQSSQKNAFPCIIFAVVIIIKSFFDRVHCKNVVQI